MELDASILGFKATFRATVSSLMDPQCCTGEGMRL